MLNIIKTDSGNTDFLQLVALLDQELAITDGDDHAFYDQFNKVDKIKYVLVAYENGQAVGCGALKAYGQETMEIKRMYTLSEFRGKGIASQILATLEKWASELGFNKCILETGINQQAAISLYHKRNYLRIPNYGPYKDVINSFCFEKRL